MKDILRASVYLFLFPIGLGLIFGQPIKDIIHVTYVEHPILLLIAIALANLKYEARLAVNEVAERDREREKAEKERLKKRKEKEQAEADNKTNTHQTGDDKSSQPD